MCLDFKFFFSSFHFRLSCVYEYLSGINIDIGKKEIEIERGRKNNNRFPEFGCVCV